MPRKPSKTQERLEAIMTYKGKKSLKEIWDEDRELEPKRVDKLITNASLQGN